MMMKTKLVICSVLTIVLTACLVSTGCTSTQVAQTPVQTIPPTVITPSQTQSPTILPAATAATIAPTTVPTAMITTTQTPATTGVSVTVNSALKKTNIGSSTNMPGNIFLVLDVTIQNNDKNENFEYKFDSFKIFDKSSKKRFDAITNKFTSGLNSPLTSGTIPLKSKQTGQIVFGVPEESNSYRLTVVDPTGTVLTTIDNMNVP